MRAPRGAAIGILAAVLAGGCSGTTSISTGPRHHPPPPLGGINITIQDFQFFPAVDTIKVGTAVQWVNDGPSEHSTTSDTGVWDSNGLTPPGGGGYGNGSGGATFRYTFNQPGTYTYHCSFHPPSAYPSFVGRIVVTN